MTIDYGKDKEIAVIADATTDALPPLCEATNCRTQRRGQYDGVSLYGRGYGYMQVKDRTGALRWICQACALRALDQSGRSVMAQLLADPESIPSIVREQQAAHDRLQQAEREYRDRRDHGET